MRFIQLPFRIAGFRNYRLEDPTVSLSCLCRGGGEGSVSIIVDDLFKCFKVTVVAGSISKSHCRPDMSGALHGLVCTRVCTVTNMFLRLCRYYGLSVWFPDVIKHLQSDEYALLTKNVQKDKYANFSINFTMENQIHTGMEYDNGRSGNLDIIYHAS